MSDRDLLQGPWLMQLWSEGGSTYDLEFRDAGFADVNGNKLRFYNKMVKFEGVMSLDPSGDPKKIDLVHVNGKNLGARERGIYRIEQGVLSLCLSLEGNRAEEFAAPKGSGLRLYEFRRLTLAEEKVIAGTSPATSWVKGPSKVGRCEVSFPVKPRFDFFSESRATMHLPMPNGGYSFVCVRLPRTGLSDAKRLEQEAEEQTRTFGKVIRARTTTTTDGHPNYEALLEDPDPAVYRAVRLVIAHDFLYGMSVLAPKAFHEAPNVSQFFASLAIRAPKVNDLLADFQSSDPDTDIQTITALERRGPGVIPEIVAGMSDPNKRIRSSAVRTLRKFGSGAKVAVPELELALRDPDGNYRADVVATLEAIGPPAITAMVKALPADSSDYFTLTSALDRVDPNWRASNQAKLAVPTLIANLSAKDASNRRWAIRAVGELGPLAKDAVPDLAGFLADRDQDVRASAADALVRFGPYASGAKAALLRSLEDPLPHIRKAAATSLANVGPSVLPDLVKTLASRTAEARAAAVEAMGQLGPGGRGAVPHLTRALGDTSGYVKLAAIEALGQFGPLAGEALPALEALSEGPYGVEARMAIRRLQK